MDFKVDRTVVTFGSLDDEPDERRWWWRQSPQRRLAAIEAMRQVMYGRAATHGRLQRVLEITQRQPR